MREVQEKLMAEMESLELAKARKNHKQEMTDMRKILDEEYSKGE